MPVSLEYGLEKISQAGSKIGQEMEKSAMRKAGMTTAEEIQKQGSEYFKGGVAGKKMATGLATMGDIRGAAAMAAEAPTSPSALFSQMYKSWISEDTSPEEKARLEPKITKLASYIRSFRAAGSSGTTSIKFPDAKAVSMNVEDVSRSLTSVPGLEGLDSGFVWKETSEAKKEGEGFIFKTKAKDVEEAFPQGWRNETFSNWINDNAKLLAEGSEESLKTYNERISAYTSAIEDYIRNDPQITNQGWAALSQEERDYNIKTTATAIRNYMIQAGADQNKPPKEGKITVKLSPAAVYVSKKPEFIGVGKVSGEKKEVTWTKGEYEYKRTSDGKVLRRKKK